MKPSVPGILLLTFVAMFVWSGIAPKDRFTWWLEIFPALVGVPILVVTYRRFRFTNLSYILLWIIAIGTLIGGHYTYSEVPAGDWLREWFGLKRNHYDRVGHFAQGFCPAIPMRELIIRRTRLKSGGWVFFVVTSICLALAALYELIEWIAAVSFGSGSTAFLGTQGDEWDAQWDMALALVGAMIALPLFKRLHDRQIRRLAHAH